MIAIAITPTITRHTLLDWYVDSVSGDDGNDGKSSASALQTLAGLLGESLATGDRIGLANGSSWAEELDLSAFNSMALSTYGAGNRPIITAADSIASGDWSKTAGRTNVYECSKTLAETGITDPWINVFENDIHLTNVADLATCDSTSGSYYVADHDTTPFTLYIHTNASDDPETNGSTYDYSNRDSALTIGANCSIAGLELLRQRGGNGSLKAGRYVSVSNCHLKDGCKHNAYAEDGASFTNCTFHIGYWGSSSPSMLILNENTPASLGCSVRSCTFSQDTFSLSPWLYGISWHNNVSGNFGAITIDDCTFDELYSAVDVLQDATSCTATNCTVTATVRPFRAYVDLTLDSCTITNGNGTGGSLVKVNADITLTLIDCNLTSTIALTGGAIRMDGYTCTVILTGSTLIGMDSSVPGTDNILYCIDSDPTITATNNTFTLWTRVCHMAAGVAPTMTMDFNHYTAAQGNRYNGNTYVDLAGWQAGEGFDLNSTEGP